MKGKNQRGNYLCARCKIPKKGHVCPYERVFRKARDDEEEGGAGGGGGGGALTTYHYIH